MNQKRVSTRSIAAFTTAFFVPVSGVWLWAMDSPWPMLGHDYENTGRSMPVVLGPSDMSSPTVYDTPAWGNLLLRSYYRT